MFERLKWKKKEYAIREIQEGNLEDFDKYAPDQIKNDKDVLLEVCKIDRYRLNNIPKELHQDKDFILECVKVARNYYDWFKNLPYDIRNEKEFMTDVLKNNCEYLKYADELRDDKKFVLEISEQYFINPSWLGENLKNDREINLKIISMSPILLDEASKTIRDDREIVLAAVTQEGTSFRYASKRLRNDPEIALLAIMQDLWSVNYIGEKLAQNKAFIRAVKELFDQQSRWKLCGYPGGCGPDYQILMSCPDYEIASMINDTLEKIENVKPLTLEQAKKAAESEEE